ncbi:sulfite reductase subunit beta [Vararia minispora EC-137]|uniref:Sulfite reductase subunit beta n=1 Tax=Vararia minispora EC-137 TaxID=1314806 RepID=A0ACB8QPN5_9AGAM|nr:sulfite reductase subunit beta [Vararia minispora EC-137]
MALTPAVAAVARVAYFASDTIVDSASAFSPYWASRPTSSIGASSVTSLPAGADAGATLLHTVDARLTSYTTDASQALSRLLPHLPELSSRPIVIHVAADKDLSDAIVLRAAVPFFIHSPSAQKAHDNALLASRLARTESKVVLHVFHLGSPDESVEEVAEDQVKPFLLAEKPAVPSSPVSPVTDTSGVLIKAYETASHATATLLRRPQHALSKRGDPAPETIIFTLGRSHITLDVPGAAFVDLSLASPFPISDVLASIGPSTSRIFVCEQIQRWSMKWTPVFLDVVSALQRRETEVRPTVTSVYLGDTSHLTEADFSQLLSRPPSTRLQLGITPSSGPTGARTPHVPKHEASYSKILTHLFGDRLQIVNAPELVSTQGALATSPEFALGRIRGDIRQREALVTTVERLLQTAKLPQDLHSLFSGWLLAKDDGVKSRQLGDKIVAALESGAVSHEAASHVLALRTHLSAPSRWIIGSDAWSYDIGASGLHHAITSGLNINVLLLDTTPYSARNAAAERRKQDVGLYAMNHGDVYVASVAIYSSYGQVLQALVEADRYNGPSVVLAYLPYATEDTPALTLLKETKNAVDTGYWPLYRWDPTKEAHGLEPFALDSDAVKRELQTFLDRQNHLSQLTRTTPQLAAEVVSSFGETVKAARKSRAQKAYADLLTGIDAPPVTILYASDGGAAEKKAKRLAGRAQARGLSTTLSTMDAFGLDTVSREEHVIFITSTAGQGEPPQNGRSFFKALSVTIAKGEKPLTSLKYSVFGMGDSHYWPRAEDAHFYNKPSKDLDARLAQLGGERFADLGLGDDQDADGAETGYKVWEPKVWKAFGVDAVEVQEAEPEPITNEHIKAASAYLRGTIAEGLEDHTTGALAVSDTQLTKFHGIYQQDDRDIRDERTAQGVEPAYSFMIRVRLPGGVCTPRQWLAVDQIADEHGAGHFKITTRQTFQFHGVIKRHLKPAIREINRALMDTLAACGDVNRNVLVSAIPSLSKLHEQVYAFAKATSEHLLPRTSAYHEIWLDKKLVAGEVLRDREPLYGEFYLPRKFKVAVAVPPTNDVDVFANDVGFIAIMDDQGELAGFNVTAGGGMGVTHGNKKTYPRTGSILGFVTPDKGVIVAEKIMLVQRDNGNRVDRKNARLKYTIDRMGLDVFKAEVEKLLGFEFEPARGFQFDRNVDDYGWQTGADGKHYFTTFVENGRVQDEPSREFKTAFREIAKVHKGNFRLTANQHIIITEVANEDLPEIKRLLAKYKLDNINFTGLRLSSSACVAFPTCGLAMAESERYLPMLIDKVEKIMEENGLRNDSIVMRMTGCPNGCARPYLAEVAFVGKAPGTYLMLLGGGYYGQRLNKIYRESVTEPEILAILRPMIKRYALERHDGERFGDFVIRVGYIAPTTEGKAWYDRMGGEGQHRLAATA